MASLETFTAESDTGKKRTMSHTLLIRYMQCGPTLSRYREVGADVRTVLRLDSEAGGIFGKSSEAGWRWGGRGHATCFICKRTRGASQTFA